MDDQTIPRGAAAPLPGPFEIFEVPLVPLRIAYSFAGGVHACYFELYGDDVLFFAMALPLDRPLLIKRSGASFLPWPATRVRCASLDARQL